MKALKQKTNFTLSRDAIRLLTILTFIVIVFVLQSNFKFENSWVILLSVILAGPFFCGWLCPMGNASYFMSKLGTKVFPKLQFNLSPKADKRLKYLRYFFAIVFLGGFAIARVGFLTGHPIFATNYVELAYMAFMPVAVLVLSLFIARFFCKYLCWHKAIYNLTSRVFKTTKIVRQASSCINCGKCDKACPMTLKLSKQEKTCGADCLSCFNCLDKGVCPAKKQTLALEWFGIKVNYMWFSIIAITAYIVVTTLVVL